MLKQSPEEKLNTVKVYSAVSWVLTVVYMKQGRTTTAQMQEGRPTNLAKGSITGAALELFKMGVFNRYPAKNTAGRNIFTYELAKDWSDKLPEDFPWEGVPRRSVPKQPSGVTKTRSNHGFTAESKDVIPLTAAQFVLSRLREHFPKGLVMRDILEDLPVHLGSSVVQGAIVDLLGTREIIRQREPGLPGGAFRYYYVNERVTVVKPTQKLPPNIVPSKKEASVGEAPVPPSPPEGTLASGAYLLLVGGGKTHRLTIPEARLFYSYLKEVFDTN